ncbi:protein of unknown function [Pseudomonas mediterranea]
MLPGRDRRSRLCGEGIHPRWAAKQPQSSRLNLPDAPSRMVLGLLRTPAGMNPLATMLCSQMYSV